MYKRQIQYWTADPNSPVAGVEAWRTDTPATDPRTRNFVAASAIWGGTGGLCREPYVAPSGVRAHYPGGQCVQSPNYPNPYPATSSCSIRATFGDGITSALAFEYFETSPGDDYIEIDGVQYSGLKNGAATVTAVAQAPALDSGRRLTATANAGSGSYPGSVSYTHLTLPTILLV